MVKNRIGSLSYLLPGVLALFIWQGCANNGEREPTYLIGFSQCTGNDAWRRTMQEDMARELAFHPEVKLITLDAEGDNDRQVKQVRELLEKEIDLLIVSPNEAAPITPVVEEVFNKGIPVIIVDRRTTSPLYSAYVGADNYQIGYIAGHYAANQLGSIGNIMEIWGLRGSTPAIDRHQGFVNALRDYPDITIVDSVDGEWLRETARQRIPPLLQARRDIDLVFAHNDMMALAAYQVAEQMGRADSIVFLGVDGLAGPNGGIQFVANGILDATFLYPTGGEQAIRIAVDILNQRPYEKENILQTTVIDSTNVRILKLQADKVLSQQYEIERQQEELQEQQATFYQQRMVMLALGALLLIAVVLASITLLNLRSKQEVNRDLQQKNAEILLQRNKIEEMAAEAEAANQAKLRFFTNISHEFRTPLSLILAPVEDFLSRRNLHPGMRQELQIVRRNVLRLVQLINKLMDFRRLENDKMTVRATQQDIGAFVQEMCTSFQPLAARRQIELQVQVPPRPVMVWFDTSMIDKVLFNLLSNAFKYTPDDGRVQVTLEELDNRVAIRVQDTGRGLSEEEAEHLFERFYRKGQQKTGGTGLGLALTKELVECHRGHISVHSQPGAGATFIVELLLGDSHLAEDEKTRDLTTYVLDQQFLDLAHPSPLLEPPPPSSEEKEHAVLIIEDNPDMLNFLTRKLSKFYNVIQATGGQQGLELAQQYIPDLILSDVMMPGMDGFSLCRLLKERVTTSHIPVVLLTAQSDVDRQIEGLQAGADAYITKPFHYELLLERLRSLIYNRHLLQMRMVSGQNLVVRHNATTNLDQEFVDQFIKTVEANLGNPEFHVHDICTALGLSRVQLYRKVKALLGYSVNDYIQNMRLKRAMQLLARSDTPISDIAYEVGFSSPSYFSTVFKGKYQLSPSEYREKHQ
ncbi:MAG: substrate-binding domain-containing protein [Lewinella sp.]|nr:substrate-binding domain-containing protein [Lewinella sp.]